jgi:hypothetical protein
VVPIHEGAEPVRASLDDTDLAIVRALQGIDGVARTRTAVVLSTPVRRGPVV